MALGLFAASSLLASEMPGGLAWPLAAFAAARGAWLAHRHRRQPARVLCWVAGRPPELDGAPLSAAVLHWRGPLAFLRWRDASGRMRRLAWWPDTLPQAARRELKLVAQAAVDTPATPSMAP
ncbi:MAG: hypothetical protein ACTHKZ_08425 [Lysobacteraceae bacterium]